MIEFLSQFFDKIVAFFTAILISLGIISAPVNAKQTKVMEFPGQYGCNIVEGGCTDGKYLYITLIDTSAKTERENPASGDIALSATKCRVIKIDTSAWTVSKYSEELKIDHANDMTYNPKTNKILISNNEPNFNAITVLDPYTLQIESKHILLNKTDTDNSLKPIKIYSISYDEANDCYYCGISNSSNFVKLNSDFTYAKDLIGYDMNLLRGDNSKAYTRQTIETDNGYFYSTFYLPNSVFKYSFEGELIGKYEFENQNGEAEFSFFLNNEFYVCYNIQGSSNPAGIIYKVENPEFNLF